MLFCKSEEGRDTVTFREVRARHSDLCGEYLPGQEEVSVKVGKYSRNANGPVWLEQNEQGNEVRSGVAGAVAMWVLRGHGRDICAICGL